MTESKAWSWSTGKAQVVDRRGLTRKSANLRNMTRREDELPVPGEGDGELELVVGSGGEAWVGGGGDGEGGSTGVEPGGGDEWTVR